MDNRAITLNTPIGPSDVEPLKKYIRTFAGDMETVKEGEIPDLEPLVPPAPVPASDTVEHPSMTPAAPTPPQPPIPKPEPPKPSPIETYADDFLQRMKKTRASTATVLAAEQDSAKGPTQKASEKNSRGNVLYIIAGIVLLLLGSSGAYIAYTRYLIKVQPIVLELAASAPIFVDEREKISGATPAEILQAIKQSVARELPSNTVRLLYTDLSTTTDNSVFSALQLPAPGVLLRNVNAARSMTGIVNAGGSQTPFFILSVAAYGNTFAGMLSWEPTMERDLNDLFPAYQQVSTTTVATSTQFLTPSFRDEIVNNHDVRIYRDADGRSVFLYGYWNQTTLIIARDPAEFIEIIGRLATTRTQ